MSLDASDIRVAVVGTGFMGQVHMRAIARAGAHLTGIVSRSAESAAAATNHWRDSQHFDSLEELLAADVADIVHICTPNHLHARQAMQVLTAGLDVICEKPLATGLADARSLGAAAEAAQAVTGVPFVYRFSPVVREMRDRIRSGESGEVTLVHGRYLQDWLAQAENTNWRVDDALGGPSRTFGDIGVHWVDLFEFVTGHRVTQLSATMTTTVPSRSGDNSVPTEDIVTIQFESDQGAVGAATMSQVSPGRKNQLVLSVDTELAGYEFQQEHPNQLWVGEVERTTIIERGDALRSDDAHRMVAVPAGHPQGYQDNFDAFVADVYRAVLDPDRPPEGLPTFADGVRAAVVTDAVLRSADSGTWVDVGKTAWLG